MKYLNARSTGGITWSAPWPPEAPALHRLDLPTRLRVPVMTGDFDASSAKPPTTTVARGDRLTTTPLEACPTPLAPTSGRIVGVGRAVLLDGRSLPAIELEPDFEDRATPTPSHDSASALEQHERAAEVDSAGKTDLPAWIEILLAAGIYADRAGSPDLISQLTLALRRPVDTVICTLLDGDAPLRLNTVLASRAGQALATGLALLGRITGARRTAILVEAGVPWKWWAPMDRLARQSNFSVISLPLRYPQHDPTLLLYDLLARRLRPGRSPVEQGALLVDAAAAVAVGRRAGRQQPMLQVPLAVRDHIEDRCTYMIAPIGMSLRQVLNQAGRALDGVQLRAGDLLRQQPVDIDAVIGPTELTVHLLSRWTAPAEPCIRCGYCDEACPTAAQPAGLLEAAQREDMALAEKHGIESCIECGVCSYVCPSRLPLLQAIRTMKHASNAPAPVARSPS